MKRILCILLTIILSTGLFVGCADEKSKNNEFEISLPKEFSQTGMPEEGETVAIIHVKDLGDICVKFFYEDSPLAVENFITLASSGYYDGVIFHRVIDSFMIQSGDPTGTGFGGESMWGKEFKNEYSDRLIHMNGALAMARTDQLDTNGSQFFINYAPAMPKELLSYFGVDEKYMDAYAEFGGNPHLQDQYTVFGQVYEGMDIVEKISKTETDGNDKPLTDIEIESIEVTQYK